MGQWGSIKVRKLKYKKSNKYYKGTAADGSCWKSSRRQKKGCFSLRSYLLYPAMVQNYYDTGLVAYTIR